MTRVIDNVGTRQFKIDEYHRMVEAGAFAPGERVELIRGAIREMTPKGRRHVIAVAKLDRIFQRLLADRASTYVQDPLAMKNWHSEPEPDVTVTSDPDVEAYGDSSPQLVVEVADTSLEYDRTEKSLLYAEAGVPEYWILNLVDDVLEVHRDPRKGVYQTKFIHEQGSSIAPLAWPDLELEVSDLFPAPVEPAT